MPRPEVTVMLKRDQGSVPADLGLVSITIISDEKVTEHLIPGALLPFALVKCIGNETVHFSVEDELLCALWLDAMESRDKLIQFLWDHSDAILDRLIDSGSISAMRKTVFREVVLCDTN